MKPSAAPALALVSLVFLSAQSSGDGAKGWKGGPKPAASPKAAVAMDGSLDGRVMLGRPEAGSIALSAYFDLPSE